MNWLWFFRLFWNRFSKNSNFSDFPSKMGSVVERDWSNFDSLLMLFLKLAEILLFATCWSTNKIWSASIVARVFSLGKCGWLVERAFFCLPEEAPEEQQGTPFWTPVTMWEVSSGSESVWLLARQAENSTSGWGSFRERSPLGSWFSALAFRNVPGKAPENVHIDGFTRILSN